MQKQWHVGANATRRTTKSGVNLYGLWWREYERHQVESGRTTLGQEGYGSGFMGTENSLNDDGSSFAASVVEFLEKASNTDSRVSELEARLAAFEKGDAYTAVCHNPTPGNVLYTRIQLYGSPTNATTHQHPISRRWDGQKAKTKSRRWHVHTKPSAATDSTIFAITGRTHECWMPTASGREQKQQRSLFQHYQKPYELMVLLLVWLQCWSQWLPMPCQKTEPHWQRTAWGCTQGEWRLHEGSTQDFTRWYRCPTWLDLAQVIRKPLC